MLDDFSFIEELEEDRIEWNNMSDEDKKSYT